MRKRCTHFPSQGGIYIEGFSVLICIHKLIHVIIRIAKPCRYTWFSDIVHIKLGQDGCGYCESHKGANFCSNKRDFSYKSKLADWVHKFQNQGMTHLNNSILLSKCCIGRVLIKRIYPTVTYSNTWYLYIRLEMEIICNCWNIVTSKWFASQV